MVESTDKYLWVSTMLDTSRVSTFFIAVFLIVYGSFRSLNSSEQSSEKEEKQNDEPIMTSRQALLFPIFGSLFLLASFFLFDSLQIVFTLFTTVVATVTLSFLLLPASQFISRPCCEARKISFGKLGRYTVAEILSLCVSLLLVFLWILTDHWLLMDALGMGLCVSFIALVKLPSLKVSTLLLCGLLIYDVFWVFFSSYIFNTNVMLHVASRPAENPIHTVARKLHLTGVLKQPPKLSLPAKLVFPSYHDASRFTMLGLGDVVMPGLLLCFVLRYDAYRKTKCLEQSSSTWQKMTYFHCSLIGYFVGLITATLSSEVFKAAQPALLYLVPFTLLPLLVMAYLKGDLRRMWSEPFLDHLSPLKCQEV